MADAKPHCRLVDLPTWCRQHRPGLSKKRRALLPKRVITTKPEPGPAAPGGVIGNGGCQLALSTWGLAHVVAMAPSGPIQNASRAPLKRVIAATPESARAAPGGVIGKDGCQLALSTCGLAQVVAIAPSGPIQNTSRAPPETCNCRYRRPQTRCARLRNRKGRVPIGIVYLRVLPRCSNCTVRPDPECVHRTHETSQSSKARITSCRAGNRDRKR